MALVLSLILAGVAFGDLGPGHSKPKSVSAECLATTAIVNWEQVSEYGLTGYDVYKRSTGESDLIKVNSELVSTTSYEVKSLITGLSYDFGVVAVYDDGHSSEMSSLATCTTG